VTTLPPLNIPEARRLCSEATPGPWTSEVHSADDYDDSGPKWGDLRGPDNARSVFCVDLGDFNGMSPANAAFCAAARQLLPQAIEEVERLRGLLNDAAVWLEANTDKSARRFHAKRIRMEAGL
jgi:hypothetical protein